MNTSRILALLALPLLLAACAPPAPEVVEVTRSVRYMRVVPVGDQQTRIFSGVTKAAVETDLSFKVSGLITELRANVGDVVKAGQLLARVDPTDYEVGLREAEAGLDRARAEQRSAKSAFERTRELYENRNASRNDLDRARAAAESAEAQVGALEQQVEGARLQLSYTQLSAPLACTIARRQVEENQNVSAGQPIVRVNCGDCPEVRVDMPGMFIGKIRAGIEASVAVASLAGQSFNGVVTEVGVGTNQNRSIYPVTVLLLDGCDQLRSGMAADVTMQLAGEAASEDQLVAPMVSVGEDRNGNFVFVLQALTDADGEQEVGLYVAKRRGVTLGQLQTQGMEIVAGLAEGELIATAGVRRLIDGQTVRLFEANGG